MHQLQRLRLETGDHALRRNVGFQRAQQRLRIVLLAAVPALDLEHQSQLEPLRQSKYFFKRGDRGPLFIELDRAQRGCIHGAQQLAAGLAHFIVVIDESVAVARSLDIELHPPQPRRRRALESRQAVLRTQSRRAAVADYC